MTKILTVLKKYILKEETVYLSVIQACTLKVALLMKRILFGTLYSYKAI